MTELDLQALIVQALRIQGYYVHSVPNEGRKKLHGAQYNRARKMQAAGLTSGVADLVAWLPGGITYIEVKLSGGRVSPAQYEFAAQCKAHGIAYHIVRSVGDVLDVVVLSKGKKRLTDRKSIV